MNFVYEAVNFYSICRGEDVCLVGEICTRQTSQCLVH